MSITVGQYLVLASVNVESYSMIMVECVGRGALHIHFFASNPNPVRLLSD
jgi:hypothetical protein